LVKEIHKSDTLIFFKSKFGPLKKKNLNLEIIYYLNINKINELILLSDVFLFLLMNLDPEGSALLIWLLFTGSDAGHDSLPGDLPHGLGDDGHGHEGLHGGELIKYYLLMSLITIYSFIYLNVFLGWSDQL